MLPYQFPADLEVFPLTRKIPSFLIFFSTKQFSNEAVLNLLGKEVPNSFSF